MSAQHTQAGDGDGDGDGRNIVTLGQKARANVNIIFLLLAVIKFNATSTDDSDLIREIWYYLLDGKHAFFCHHRFTRYNLIAMAYIWCLELPLELCGPGDKECEFVWTFIDAWFAYLQYASEFEAQEKFISMWQDSMLNLFCTRDKTELREMNSAVKKLMSQSLFPSLNRVVDMEAKDIIHMREDGRISEEGYANYGPTFINKKSGIAAVDRSSGLLTSLGTTVDPTLAQPDIIIEESRPKATRTPWIDVDTFFAIPRSGIDKLKEGESLSRGMAFTSLLSHSERLWKDQIDITDDMKGFSLEWLLEVVVKYWMSL
ncbi:hypothetical protein EJ02DRAFT_436342 [Clathrospora elynae]|uniref:Uncharacterized protein n=1 Tax=Clathrospora elynae TaxID=706981 RepID=A0A6A5SFS0_9PLEO|nr:hypothetical protein EJ02DRAFT_436342 [Clathrospora elynae]